MSSLGVDIGTTKTAVVVIDCMGKVQYVNSCVHNSNLDLPEGYKREQSVNKHLETVTFLIDGMDDTVKSSIRSIGISGQMHGIMFWNDSTTYSNLITWQDKRASESGNLPRLNGIEGCASLKDGFGFTTLAVTDHSDYRHCGTIHDFFVWLITGSRNDVTIDTTNAASWGLFDIKTMSWDQSAIANLGISKAILPRIVDCGSFCGEICSEWAEKLGLDAGIPVMAAIGDNQASILGSGSDYSRELYVTFGTGTQLSAVLDADVTGSVGKSEKYEIRPFVDNKVLAVAAPLCGGESWAWLKDTVKSWITEIGIGLHLDDATIYNRIDELSLGEKDSHDIPVIEPHFLGERWDETLKCVISGITLKNFGLGKVGWSLALGLARNLRNNFPDAFFEAKTCVIASGNAIRQSRALRMAVEKVFGIPIQNNNLVEEAALGAAKLSSRLVV